MAMTREPTVAVDGLTQAQTILDYAHHEAHDGMAYTISHSGTKASTEFISVVFTTPNTTKQLHLIPELFASAQATFEICEAATAAGGSSVVAYNHNRNSTNTSVAVSPVTDDTVSDKGTVIYATVLGAGNTKEGGERGAHEWILKQNTKYAFLFTSNAASNRLRLNLIWYEHTDRT